MEYSCTICIVKLLLVSCVLLILTTKGHCKFEIELSSGYQGVVIVKNDHGTIGGVCQKGWAWGDDSCVVICRQLGYSGGISLDHVYLLYRIKLYRYLLANVVCNGGERRLSDCPYDTDTHACNLEMHQGACACDKPNGQRISPPALEHPKVKLSLGFHGVVEVTRYGDTRLVCNTHWTDTECKVVCKQIGYSGGSVAIQNYPTKLDNVWLDNVVCSGTEETLDECQHGLWGVYYCLPAEDKATCKCDKELTWSSTDIKTAYPTEQSTDSSHSWLFKVVIILLLLVFLTFGTSLSLMVCHFTICKRSNRSVSENQNLENLILEQTIQETQIETAINNENEENEVRQNKFGEPEELHKLIESRPKLASHEPDNRATNESRPKLASHEPDNRTTNEPRPKLASHEQVINTINETRPKLASHEPVNRTINETRPKLASYEPVNRTIKETRPKLASHEPVNRTIKETRPKPASHEPVNRTIKETRPKLASHEQVKKITNKSIAYNISNLPVEHQRTHDKDTTKTKKSTTEEYAPAEKNMDAPLPKPEAEDYYTYKGSDNLKGLAIIVNIMKFKTLKLRQWSDNDADRLTFMWKDAGFKVHRLENPTKQELHSVIKYAQQELRKRNHGCFVCCIMSHGGIGFIHTSDDAKVPIKEAILRPFGAKHLPEFAGYPKIFLLQCCRNEELSEINLTRCEVNVKHVQSLPYSSIEDSTVSKDGQPDSNLSVSVKGFRYGGEDTIEKMRISKDFFIGYACSQGERAHRYPQMKGSAYFVYLVQNVEEKAKHHANFNWESLMDDVHEDFFKKCVCQVPIYISSLRKKIKLKLQKQL